jgi:hypothetical protein
MTDIKKLKKDIQYTSDEVYKLVSKALNYESYRRSKINPNNISIINREDELIREISRIGHTTEYTEYPEKLKHIIADHDHRATRWLTNNHKVFDKLFPERIVTTSNIVYKISLEDLPMFLDYDTHEFLIQWRLDIKK